MFRVYSSRILVQRSTNILNQTFVSEKTGQCNPPQPPNQSVLNVKGLSERVVKVPDYPVGFAGADKQGDYKNPEYFCYHVDSFADSFVEMEKYRLPAPSNKKKFNK